MNVLVKKFVSFFRYDNVKKLDEEEPNYFNYQKKNILENYFTYHMYDAFYKIIEDEIDEEERNINLELGTGAGFLDKRIINLIKSDIVCHNNIDISLSAHEIPFKDGTFSNIILMWVLHHLVDPQIFFREAIRVLKNGGNGR